jgi:hypothetical protein
MGAAQSYSAEEADLLHAHRQARAAIYELQGAVHTLQAVTPRAMRTSSVTTELRALQNWVSYFDERLLVLRGLYERGTESRAVAAAEPGAWPFYVQLRDNPERFVPAMVGESARDLELDFPWGSVHREASGVLGTGVALVLFMNAADPVRAAGFEAAKTARLRPIFLFFAAQRTVVLQTAIALQPHERAADALIYVLHVEALEDGTFAYAASDRRNMRNLAHLRRVLLGEA